MQPNQGNPTPLPPSNDYDFIMNAGNKPSPGRFQLPGTPNSPTQKAMVMGGLIFFVILFLVLVFSVFSNLRKTDTASLSSLAAEQQEILRITALAQPNLKDPVSQTAAANTKATIQSQQNELIEHAKKIGGKIDKKELALKLDPKHTTDLETAAQTGKYDETYNAFLVTSLNTYQNDLKKAYEGASTSGQALLSTFYDSNALILEDISPTPQP